MYQNNDFNEIASVCNVSFQGMEIAGRFTKETLGAFLRLVKFVMASVMRVHNWNKDRKYNMSGKKSQKVMKDKFQGDVLYASIESPQETVKKQEHNNKNFTQEQLLKLPDAKWIEKRLERLAKRHGLEFCLLANVSKQSQGIFLQYPKQQEYIYQQVMAELQEEIRKECERAFKEIDKENEQACEEEVKKCKEEIKNKENELKAAKEEIKNHHKISDKVGEQKYGELVVVLQEEIKELKEKLQELIEKWNLARKQNNKDLIETMTEESKEVVKGKVSKKITPAQYMQMSGLMDVSEEEFDKAMTMMFPKEYAEIQKELRPSQVEQEDIQNQTQKADRIRQRDVIRERKSASLLERRNQLKKRNKAEWTSSIKRQSRIKIRKESRNKKENLVKLLNENMRKEAQSQGLVTEFTIDAANYVRLSEKKAAFPHPDYPEFMVTISAKDICGMMDDSKMQKKKNAKTGEESFSGQISCSVYKDASLEFKVPVLDAVTGEPVKDKKGKQKYEEIKMNYGDFNKMVKETGITAMVAMKQKQKELDRQNRLKKKASNATPAAAKQKGAAHAKK